MTLWYLVKEIFSVYEFGLIGYLFQNSFLNGKVWAFLIERTHVVGICTGSQFPWDLLDIMMYVLLVIPLSHLYDDTFPEASSGSEEDEDGEKLHQPGMSYLSCISMR